MLSSLAVSVAPLPCAFSARGERSPEHPSIGISQCKPGKAKPIEGAHLFQRSSGSFPIDHDHTMAVQSRRQRDARFRIVVGARLCAAASPRAPGALAPKYDPPWRRGHSSIN
jgi:hypothetical protein